MAADKMTAKKIAILGKVSAEASVLCRLIEKAAYRTQIYSSLPFLEEGLALDPCLAVILDVDSVPLDNHAIRNLKASNPAVSLLMISRERFHPELQESISHVLYACLKKPADSDEITYLLKSMWDIAPGNDRKNLGYETK
jgi:DNA-binding NtrC family response regulator